MTQQPQKTFRDLLGRDIKVGDDVLHLWTKIDHSGYPNGGSGAINKKLATVIKQTPKGISIEWRDSRNKTKIKRSTVFNTTNRLIILDGKKLSLSYDDIVKDVEESYQRYRKGMATRRKNLKFDLQLVTDDRNKLLKENEEFRKAIKALTVGSERFHILDL